MLVLAGDHMYKMDYRPMLHEHAAKGADVTVGCVEVPLQAASAFGVMQPDARGWITDEKYLNSRFMDSIWQFDFSGVDAPREYGIGLSMRF